MFFNDLNEIKLIIEGYGERIINCSTDSVKNNGTINIKNQTNQFIFILNFLFIMACLLYIIISINIIANLII